MNISSLRRLAMLSLGGAVIGGYMLLGMPGGLIAWGVGLALLICSGRLPRKLLHNPARFVEIVVMAYLLISLIGLIEVGDNLRNFGTAFGRHADDSRFYERTMALLQRGEWQERTGLYEAVLGLWGVIPVGVFVVPMGALDFLPLNWGLAAFVVGWIWVFCQVTLGVSLPWWILMGGILGNYRFTDSVIHLYREPLLLVFLLLAMIAIAHRRYLRSLALALPVLLIRGANFLLCGVYFGLTVIRRRTRSRMMFYAVCALLAIPCLFLTQRAGTILLKYSSGFTQEGGSVGMETWSFSENTTFRSEMIAKQVTDGSTTAAALSGSGPLATLVRPIPYLFFPVRFWPVHMADDSHSIFARTEAFHMGTYWINVYVWVTVCCWLPVIPLMAIGLFRAMIGSPRENILFVYYILALVLVSFVSCQMRHGLSFIVINPLLAATGYRACKAHKNTRMLAWGMGGAVAAALFLYNRMEGSAL